MERKHATALAFGLILAAGLVYALVRLAALVQAAQHPH